MRAEQAEEGVRCLSDRWKVPAGVNDVKSFTCLTEQDCSLHLNSYHCWAYTPRKPELKVTMCTPVFIAALFTIARTWKQPRCPLGDEWIRKLWYIYVVEYYSAIKRNAFGSVLLRRTGPLRFYKASVRDEAE